MSRAFYNENDPGAAAWLRELIGAGLVMEGAVDERSIKEVKADDVAGYTRCHWFAGIGGWDYALHLAGWPATRPVWTASLPCQPFSGAGKRKGQADERHLWPVFLRLLRDCRPPVCFGEQVASDDGYRWLARVRDDLEEAGYAVGAADLPACCAGAPHIRQRLFWVADAGRISEGSGHGPAAQLDAAERPQSRKHVAKNGTYGRLANADGGQSGDGDLQRGGQHGQQPEDGGATGGLGDSFSEGRQGRGASVRGEPGDCGSGGPPATAGGPCGLGNTSGAGPLPGTHAGISGEEADRVPERGRVRGRFAGPDGAGHWDAFDLIPCRDGKARRTQPGLFPLANGFPGRVALLRGAGNAIVAPVAAKFIRAFLDVEAEQAGREGR